MTSFSHRLHGLLAVSLLAVCLVVPESAVAQNPSIATVTPTNGPTRGGTVITLNGTSFGTRAGSVSFGEANASITTWSDTRIVARTPEGDPGSVPVVATNTEGVSSDGSAQFDYDLPVLVDVMPTSAPQGGGVRLTITGSNFGRASSPRTWTVDGVIAEEEEGFGHDLASIVMPPLPSGGIKPIRLEINGFVSNEISLEVTPSSPSIVSVLPQTGPTQGGTLLTITGENFGVAPGSVLVCGSPSELTSWTSTRVVAVAPECYSGPQSLVLATAGGAQAPSTFTYDAPLVESVSPTDLPARGGRVITLTGSNFGRASAPRTVTVGGATAEPIEWRGHGEIVLLSPPVLPGRDVPVCVAVGAVEPSCANASTAPVQLVSVDPTSGPRSGGIRLTIRGENFGVDPTTQRTVLLGSQAATDVALLGDDTLTATSPASDETGPVQVTVNVDGAEGTLPAGFTYEAATDVEALPGSFALHANEPNPFSSRTVIALDLPRSTSYRLAVYDLRGRLVREVLDRAGPGRVLVRWDGTDLSGAPIGSGIYFYRLEAEDFVQTRRMILMR